MAPEPLKLQQVPDDGFAGLAAEAIGPIADDGLVAADYCVHGVLLALRQAEISNELPAALGQKEQLERSAKASAATTLNRTLTKYSTICAICHMSGCATADHASGTFTRTCAAPC